MQDDLINQVELLRYHLKRNYEKELVVDKNGTIGHVNCINHCLLFAFGECKNQNFSRCLECDKFFSIFANLINKLDSSYHAKLTECQERLTCYLAHQTRKMYLSAQFNSTLCELDNYGAVIVDDYKMRILPVIAREPKSQFFGKCGWTLHTTLVFQKDKNNSNNLDIRAYDHWSTDTKQDALFTASCFEAVFMTMDPKPQWVKIISDNGGHYHNSELISIISYWHRWYDVEVRRWIFLEPDEAKTTVDSHHATASRFNIH